MLEQLVNLFSKKSASILDYTKPQCVVYGDGVESESILCDEGELSSTFRVKGVTHPLTSEEFEQELNYITDNLRGLFNHEGVSLIFGYLNDPKNNDYLDSASASFDRCLNNYGLALEDIHREDLDELKKVTSKEDFFVTVETNKEFLEKNEAQEVLEATKLRNKEHGLSSDHQQYGQNPAHFIDAIYEHHIHNVSHVKSTFARGLGTIEKLSANEFLYQLKYILDQTVEMNWKAKTQPQHEENSQEKGFTTARAFDQHITNNESMDASHDLLPALMTQVVSDDIQIHEEGILSINGRYFKPMYVNALQETITQFQKFIAQSRDIPFFMNWNLTASPSKVSSMIGVGRLYGFFSIIPGSTNCKKLLDDANTLGDYEKEDDTLCLMRLSCLTWGDSWQECRRNYLSLKSRIQNWGTQQVQTEKGQPDRGVFDVLPSVTAPVTQSVFPVRLREVVETLPLSRVRSPWKEGVTNFINALDLTVYPMMLGKGQQSYPRVVYLGPTGKGKSVLANNDSISTMFSQPYSQLVLQACIDIGVTSELNMNLVRSSLPKSQHHLIMCRKIHLSERDAVNIFDTDYGARYANNVQSILIKEFLILLLSELDQQGVDSIVGTVLDSIIEFAYTFFSDIDPKEYSEGIRPEVDAKIKEHGLEPNTWWHAFDLLHDLGECRIAYQCQLEAMPLIMDLPELMSENEDILKTSSSVVYHGLPLRDYIVKRIASHTTAFPNIVSPTQFDIENARLCCLNLELVCPKGTSEEYSVVKESNPDRQSSIFYTLYFTFLTKRFFIYRKVKDFVAEAHHVEEKYHPYHIKRIEAERGIPRRFNVDEWHRAKRATNMQTALNQILREGRKYGLEFAAASQMISDFAPALLNNIPNIVTFGLNEMEVEHYKGSLGLTDSQIELCQKHLIKGRHDDYGASCVLISSVDGYGKVVVPLYYKVGNAHLWAMTTDAGDMEFRNMVEEKFESLNIENHIQATRLALTHLFPKSTIKDDMARLQAIHPDWHLTDIHHHLLEKCINYTYGESL